MPKPLLLALKFQPVRFLRFLPALILLVSTTTLFAQTAPEKWTLEKCIDYATKNNIGIQQADLNTQLNKNNYIQSYANMLPSINGGISNEWSNGKQFNLAAFKLTTQTSVTFATQLGADLTLFSGLQQVHNVLKNKYNLQAAQMDWQDTKNTVALNITTGFLQIMLAREVLQVAKNQYNISSTQKETIEKRVGAGMMPETNLLDIEAQMARDEANITNAQNTADMAMLGLRLLLQLKPDEPFDVELPVLTEEVTNQQGENLALGVYNTAVMTQPSILAAQARVKSAEFTRKMAWGTLSPTLTANGSLYDYYNTQNKSLDTSVNDYVTTPWNTQYKDQFRKSFSLTLSVPIFGKLQRITNIQNAKLQYQNALLQLESKKQSLQQTIYQAEADVRAAASAYFASKKSYDASKRAYEAQEKRYTAGASTSLDYQTAKNNLAAVESDLAKNKYTFIFKSKVLDFYQGKPITLSK